MIYLFISALVLPWVSEDTRIEHGVYICIIDIIFLKVLSIFSNCSKCLSLHEHLLSMEVLISCLRELRNRWGSIRLSNRYSIHQHFSIVLICFLSATSESNTYQIVRNPLCVREPPFLKVISLILIRFPKNLRLRAELKPIILRVVLHDPFIFMQVAQILILFRISMIIETKHFLICPVNCLRLKWNLRVLQHLSQLVRINIFQIF